MDMKKVIGENLKCFREKFGLTQDQVGNFLGIDRALISKYESGERDISYEHLSKLSDLFGVEMKVLIEANPIEREADLALAFRAVEISNEDIESISQFQRIVKSYIKMNSILHA
jgi:transcriptional regulator with XRE-family HTH domain